MSQIPPSKPVRACIFDVDGLLINSEDIYHEIYNQVLADLGRPPLSYGVKALQASRGDPVRDIPSFFHIIKDSLLSTLRNINKPPKLMKHESHPLPYPGPHRHPILLLPPPIHNPIPRPHLPLPPPLLHHHPPPRRPLSPHTPLNHLPPPIPRHRLLLLPRALHHQNRPHPHHQRHDRGGEIRLWRR